MNVQIIQREDVGGITVVKFGYFNGRNRVDAVPVYYYVSYCREGLSEDEILKLEFPLRVWPKKPYERSAVLPSGSPRRFSLSSTQADKRFQLMCTLALSGQVTFKTTEQ